MNPAGIEDLGGPEGAAKGAAAWPGLAGVARLENSTFLEQSAGILPFFLPRPHQWRRCLRRRDGHLPSLPPLPSRRCDLEPIRLAYSKVSSRSMIYGTAIALAIGGAASVLIQLCAKLWEVPLSVPAKKPC